MSGEMATKYRIEIGEEELVTTCPQDGVENSVGHGFIYKNGDAYAIYMLGWTPARQERIVSVAISIGDFDDEARIEDRTCFGLEVFPDGEEVAFSFIDPKLSPWPKTETLGSMISREQALSHPLKSEVFSIMESALRQHMAVATYLGLSMGSR